MSTQRVSNLIWVPVVIFLVAALFAVSNLFKNPLPLQVDPISLPEDENWNFDDLPDVAAELEALREFSSSIGVIEVPEYADSLADDIVTIYDPNFNGIDLVELDSLVDELDYMFNPAFRDFVAETIEKAKQDLRDANFPAEGLPQEVIDIMYRRIIVRELLVDIAARIAALKQQIALAEENGVDAEMFTLELEELEDFKRELLGAISGLFNPEIAALAWQLLDGTITEDQFRQQWNEQLPQPQWELGYR